MFPDSDIARSFACGSDKTAYVSKFGIAPCISNSFVLIFDVSLNQTTKICMSAVRAKITSSPHMRNQFMGHGTVQDLLHHFKVSRQHA